MPTSDKPKRSRSKNSALIDLYRVLLKGIKLEDLDFPERLEPEQYKDFCAYCYTTYNSLMRSNNQPFLQYVVRNVTLKQVEKTGLDARDYNELSFGRATVNGVALLVEFFGQYAREYESKFMTNLKAFDEHRRFEPLPDGEQY